MSASPTDGEYTRLVSDCLSAGAASCSEKRMLGNEASKGSLFKNRLPSNRQRVFWRSAAFDSRTGREAAGDVSTDRRRGHMTHLGHQTAGQQPEPLLPSHIFKSDNLKQFHIKSHQMILSRGV